MPIALARHRDGIAEHGGPAEVHAFQLPDDTTSGVWVAACDYTLKSDEAELVAPFTGAPCSRCGILAALASTSDAPALPAAPDPDPADESGRFAISWRERVVHLIDDDATRTEFDGRWLVMGRCGFLGWGPVISAPGGWAVCPECRDHEQET